MTHATILKINELFNSKLTKNIADIKIALDYRLNFIDANLFNEIRTVLAKAGYTDIQGQLDTLFCIVDSIKHNIVKIENINNSKVREVFNCFKKLLSLGIISFDSRIRRNILVCIYLSDQRVHIKTNFIKLEQQRELYNAVLNTLFKLILIVRSIEIKIDPVDLFSRVYDNSKQVITNMNSRGISIFAIACHFWMNNQSLIPKPFMHSWSNKDFIKTIMSYPEYESLSDEMKQKLVNITNFWSVLSDSSLMTGKIQNVDKNRKEFNQLINQILNSVGEKYIKDYLKYIKLVSVSTPITTEINNPKLFFNNFIKEIEKTIKQKIEENTVKVPTKELIVEAIHYQFMISRVFGVDFSQQRKDHLILDKDTRRRVFEL